MSNHLRADLLAKVEGLPTFGLVDARWKRDRPVAVSAVLALIDDAALPAPLDVERLRAWANGFYGPIEDYGDGESGMTQLDHGHDEYTERIEVIRCIRAALGPGHPA